MGTPYNVIAGKNVERLAALSDGVFAFAMTLLVLDLRVPDLVRNMHTDRDLWVALAPLIPRFVTYVMSFLTLGIFWVGQQGQLNALRQTNRDLTWLHLAFLLCVTFVPFSTALLATFFAFRLALVEYWVNILLLGAALYSTWHYAVKANLIKPDLPEGFSRAVDRRIIIAQTLYLIGAALCIIDTRLSIGFIFLVQLNYAIAPRLWLLWRL